MATSIFAHRSSEIYTRYLGEIVVGRIVGGVPSNPRVAEAWIRKNMGADNETLIREMVVQTMVDRGVELSEATDAVIASTKLNGFRRCESGLYVKGYQLKAAIKEAANVSWPKRKWGPTSKGTRSFWAEHVFVCEDRLLLGVTEPTEIQQRFVSVWRGQGITYEEVVDDAKISFTVETDQPEGITNSDWEELWVRAEHLGLGATRSLGFGTFAVVRWDLEGRTKSKKARVGD